MWPLRLSRKQHQGQQWEQHALRHLQQHGLKLVEANYRCKSGEIDLICLDGKTYVFVEVRQRADGAHGGAAASITPAKQRRVIHAAQTWLMRFPSMPACRIDVVAVNGGEVSWLRNAIEV
jgi:putative endonuclease